MNIITWLIDEGHCKNVPHAEATIALLKLGELYAANDDAGIIARVELYEAWKKSGIYKKSDRAVCAMKAIAGETVPQEFAAMLIEANETITYLREKVRRLTLGLKK